MVHLHLHESKEEITLHQAESGNRPIARLQALGLINSRLQAVHMTDLTEREIDQLAAEKVRIAHCPESNLKLASGICPTHTLLKHGIVVGLGTDGAASNNDLDMFQELRAAAMLAKVTSGDPTALDAFSALEMATIGGAEFLGLADLVGSLEPGKAADMIAVDLSDIRHQPVYHPISQLAYTATGQDVTHTWVAGRLLYAERQHNSSDVTALTAEVARWQAKIQGMS
jgi:5-methylthioadenosine/S-adenosylhomocysteine deaminase